MPSAKAGHVERPREAMERAYWQADHYSRVAAWGTYNGQPYELFHQVLDDVVELVDERRDVSFAGTPVQPRAGNVRRQPFAVAVRHHAIFVTLPDRHRYTGVERDTPVVDEGQVVVGKRRAREREDELLQRVSQVFQPDQIQPPRGYLEIIRAACTARELDLAADEAERLWRAASGAAHGKYWPSQELQQVHIGDESQSGHVRSVRIPNASGMTDVLRAAQLITQFGIARFVDYSGADTEIVMAEAQQWVTQRLPLRPDADPKF